MARMMFVNLPVDSPAASRAFYEALGFEINENFTDDTATCVVVSEMGIVMLLARDKFAEHSAKPVADPSTTTCLITLSADSREEVDRLVATAVEAGGSVFEEPTDYGFMYSHSFADPDGNSWGIGFMEQAAVESGPAAYEAQQA